MASKFENVATPEQRGLLDRGLPPLDTREFIRQRLQGGEFTRWKEANQQQVIALMPDGTTFQGARWEAEMQRRRIGQLMAWERTLKTGSNLTDPFAGAAFSAALSWGVNADAASDIGAALSPLQYSPQNFRSGSRSTANKISPAPSRQQASRSPSPAGSAVTVPPPRPVGASPTANRPTIPGSPRPGPGETLVGSSRSQMRSQSERIIASDPNHPLRFLLGPNGRFKSQQGLSHAELIERPDLVQMGHIESNKRGGPERLMLQGSWENQFNNITIETPGRGGSVLYQPSVSIGGVAVDMRTASFWEALGWLKAGTVRNAAQVR